MSNFAVEGDDGFVRISNSLDNIPTPREIDSPRDDTLIFDDMDVLDDWRDDV